MTVVAAVCLCFVTSCSSPANKVELKNATFKSFSMDVPANWIEKYNDAELKSNTIQIKSDDSTLPDAFLTISHLTSPYSFLDSSNPGWMKSLTGNDMDPIEVDGIEGGISFSKVPNYHSAEVLFYTPDGMTEIRILFDYKDTSQEKWEQYAGEFYKTIKLN